MWHDYFIRLPKPSLLIPAGLFLATILAYLPVRGNDFVNFDDPDYVTANPHVRQGLTPASIDWALTSTDAANWFPVTRLSHLLDVQLFGLDPAWHHLDNVLLHALATLLLFAFLNRATSAPWPSALVAFLFALHPLHVESVAWISERKDTLSALFWFLGLYCFVRYTEKKGLPWYVATFAAFCLGILSKPMLVTFPFVMLLVDVWPLRRRRTAALATETIPFFGVALASAIATYFTQSASGAVDALATPFALRLENALVTVFIYIGKMFWPTNLAVFYPYPAEIPVWQPIAAALAILGISYLAIRTRPYLAVGWFWYLGTLVPVLGLVQVGAQARADRYTYIPLVGLFIALSWGLAELRPKSKNAVIAVSAAACAACAILTWIQISYWRDSESLFEHALASTSRNDIAEHNLGSFLMTTPGRENEAIRHLEASLQIRPNSVKAHTDLGTALSNIPSRLPEAVEQYQAALQINPSLAITHNNLGNTLAKLNRLPEAIAEYKTALQIDPNYADAQNNLEKAEYSAAMALAKQGNPAAIPHFEAALQLNPNNAEAHNNLGVVLAGSPQAIGHFEAALKINPNYADAHVNLALALANIPTRRAEAIRHLEAAQKIHPDPEVQQMLIRLHRP